MAQRKTLTEAQLDILRWINDGCPDGVMPPDDYAHRISAAALSRRGLASTSGHGQSWTATITEEGRKYLASTKGPDAPNPREPNKPVTRQLVDDIVAAGGNLRVPRKGVFDREGVDYRRRAMLAEQYGRVPVGKRLAVESVSDDELEISLVEADGGTGVGLRPVSVPERVSRYHDVVRRFRSQTGQHEVSRAALPRACHILQGLVVEAEHRGHQVGGVSIPKSNRRREGWSGPENGHVVITVEEQATALRIHEEGLASRTSWEDRNRIYSGLSFEREPRYPPLTEYEAGATGRLTISVAPAFGRDGRPAKWSDRKPWTLEEKLPEVLREVEVRAVEAERERRRREEAAAQRRRDWEAAMARAKERYSEAILAQALDEQATSWRRAREIRAYCDAAAVTHPDDLGTRDWIEWARGYADRIDPLSDAPRSPELPESVHVTDLEPFLDGWSPYGPDRRYR